LCESLLKVYTMFTKFLTYYATTFALKDCTEPGSIGRMMDSGYYPEHPVRGEPFGIWITYEMNRVIWNGTISHEFIMNNTRKTEIDTLLCEEVDCPIAKGFHNETGEDIFPKMKKGAYDIIYKWKTLEGDPVLCYQIHFEQE
jgi:hypothetical protein